MPAEELRRLVQSRLDELGISARQAARNREVSYEVLRQILRGDHSGRLFDRTARGLADALQVPVARVFAVTGIKTYGPWVLPTRFERVVPEHRAAIERMCEALLSAYDMSPDHEGE